MRKAVNYGKHGVFHKNVKGVHSNKTLDEFNGRNGQFFYFVRVFELIFHQK